MQMFLPSSSATQQTGHEVETLAASVQTKQHDKAADDMSC